MSKFNLSQLMNEKSKSEAAPVKKPFDIELLPIEKIIPSQMNKYTVADVEDLKASIEMMGLQQNLLVRERDAGDYEIISGHRRFKAMQELYAEGNADFAKVPCKVIKSMDDVTAELQLLFANSTSRQLTDYERTYQAKRIRELLTDLKKSGFKFTGRMREIVAGIIEMSPAQVGRMESINENLSPEFTEEFKAGKIGVTAAYELSRLSPKQQAYKMAEYQQTGVIEVKGIRQRCEQAKPQPAEKPQPPAEKPKGTAFDENRCPLPLHIGIHCTNGVIMKKHFMKGGNLEGCAGCCAMCTEDKKCEYVCDPYKQEHPAPQLSKPAMPAVTGETSDGYHTFNELYYHRAVLFSVVCSVFPELAWKSKHHHDGTMFDGDFIVGIKTPKGQAAYHYDMKYWDMFHAKKVDFAPEWDGYTPAEAIERIASLRR